jgi:hypothetical protein
MSTSARAIIALTKIMDNKKNLLSRRIDACEALLSYEAPDETVEKAKAFLTAIFEDSANIGIDDRLSALKLMRKASAPRVTQQTVRSADADKTRELYRDIEIAGRRMRLIAAGMWPPPSKDWADDLLGSDYVAPIDRSLNEVFEG